MPILEVLHQPALLNEEMELYRKAITLMNKRIKLSALLAAGVLAVTLTGCTQAPAESASITIGEYQGSVGSLESEPLVIGTYTGSVGSLEGMNFETTEYKEALAAKLNLSISAIQASDTQILCLTDVSAAVDKSFIANLILTDTAHADTDYAASTHADFCLPLAPTDLMNLDFHANENGRYLTATPSEDGLILQDSDVTSNANLEGAYLLETLTVAVDEALVQ
jgi:hypothetical protein